MAHSAGFGAKRRRVGEAGSADWLPDTREEMLCNFMLTKEETREELPNTREEIQCNFMLTGTSSDFGCKCKKHRWKTRFGWEPLDIAAQKLIHCFCYCLFNSSAVVPTSILVTFCVTCFKSAAVRKIESAPMTRPACGRSDSSERPHFTNFLQLFRGFPSNFGRAVSQQPVVKAGRPLMTHIGAPLSPHASRQNT